MAGSSGMAMNFGSESTQGSILASTGNASAGTVVKLTDSSGNVIAEFTPTVSFQTVVISTPDITSDGTYTLTVGDSTQEITMSGYIYGSGMGGGFGGCTINLVKDGLLDKFVETAKGRFKEKYGHEPKVYPVVISDGARKL